MDLSTQLDRTIEEKLILEANLLFLWDTMQMGRESQKSSYVNLGLNWISDSRIPISQCQLTICPHHIRRDDFIITVLNGHIALSLIHI